MQNTDRLNRGQLSPGLNDATNGYTEVVFQTEIASPARNAFGHRSGQRQAEEELWRDPRYSSSFVGGAAIDQNDRAVYEVVQAPNARGRLASGQAIPAWDAVDDQMKRGLTQGLDDTVASRPSPHPWQPRAGHGIPIGPTSGFGQGERPGTFYPSKIAPANGGRGRRNAAEIQD